ncbi:hypothetical protein SISSUDRAFT_1046813 [Sistotremastrum suecicum HHB10207 ss-3]|uniref:Uncharacterized protein n=1 Tax=Sistotremastrum suecicum HHB10207 ss-3 TaxID=1314776 RepID=A0A166DHH3_9AGAM|nr:hypothetical protein SISSUDRAFT_1046813 [Sistotremastrum suecicum HHB10207 ss-3]
MPSFRSHSTLERRISFQSRLRWGFDTPLYAFAPFYSILCIKLQPRSSETLQSDFFPFCSIRLSIRNIIICIRRIRFASEDRVHESKI